jgi:hypothetical protein
MSTSVAVILGVFFAIGIAMGTVIVIALAAVRADRAGKPDEPSAHEPGWAEPPPPDSGWEDPATDADDRPSWPENPSDGFRRE